jgi:Prion-inhibition and propagation
MTDMAGLVLGLPGLFVSCVECFEYIQLGRKLEEDYDTTVLRLSNIGLSLSRWGKSMGLHGTAPLDKDQIAALEPEARPLLEGILRRFEKVSNKSEELKLKATNEEVALVRRDMNSEARGLYTMMHTWMHTRYINQQNRVKKVRWAVYDKKALNSLISDLRELVDDLVKLFPAAQPSQRQLCEVEVSELEDNMLVLMQDIAKDDDEIMEEVARAEIAQRKERGHSFEKFDIEGKSDLKFRAGNFVARGATVTGPGSSYDNFKIRGSGDVHTGDKYE